MKRIGFGVVAFGLGILLMALPALSQPPGGKEGRGGMKDGKMPKGGFKLGSALPPNLAEEMKLTDEQKIKLQQIERDLKGKLDNLLTDEQKKIAENFRPGVMGGMGGRGGGPGEKGGKGPPGGGKGGDGPERPPFEKSGDKLSTE